MAALPRGNSQWTIAERTYSKLKNKREFSKLWFNVQIIYEFYLQG